VRAIPLVLLVAVGCNGRDDLDGRRRPLPGLEPPGQELHLAVESRQVAWDLHDNRASAVVHTGGALAIECGTADFAKYAEGAYRSPWILGVDDGGVRAALVPGLGGELWLPIDGGAGGVHREADGGLFIHIQARPAVANQLVSVFLNERRLGDIAMPKPEWGWFRIRAPAAAVRDGENKLRFYFRSAGTLAGARTAAALARIRVGGPGPGPNDAAPPLRTGEITRGGQHLAALSVAGPTRISYYLQLPHAPAQLVLAVAGAAHSLQIKLAGGSRGDAVETVWSGSGADTWQQAKVELGNWSGQVVRLDLISDGAADWGRPQITVAVPPPAATAPARAPADHVVIWVVASLRADRVGVESPPTPNFSRFLQHSLRFTHLSAAAPSPGPAHAALMTGAYPSGDRIAPEAKTLAERFREAGYATALVSGNGFVNDEAGFAQGADLYLNPMRRRMPFSADLLWQKARKLLSDRKDGHAFVYLATVEPHLPYHPTADSLRAEWPAPPLAIEPATTAALAMAVAAGKRTLTGDERGYLEALYDACVRDADAAFGDMLADLDHLGVADRTAVILVGDHGEELFERGGFGHGNHLYQEVLRVPLAIHLPGQSSGQVIDAPVEQIDVYATALDLAGVTANPESQGRSLLPLVAGATDPVPRPVFALLPGQGRSLLLGDLQIMVPLRGSHHLYDLASDPGQHTDLMGTRPLWERWLRNTFGIGVAYQSVWNQQRWGTPAATTAAFAADHGL
jgi:arylsulfatase A-like enzyme